MEMPLLFLIRRRIVVVVEFFSLNGTEILGYVGIAVEIQPSRFAAYCH